jgi:UDP-3-O-[3-hydroxymyristoyl] glucosamine N-acyltransferase
LRQLADWVQGELVGDGDTPIAAARPITEAQAGDITFAEDDVHVEEMRRSPASAALVPPKTPFSGKPLIRIADPLLAFARVAQRFQGFAAEDPCGVHPAAYVHPSARIARGARIEPFAVIGAGASLAEDCWIGSGAVIGPRCRLGREVQLRPHVVLYEGTVIGNRVTIHAGSVIGADGFGYRNQGGVHVKVPQLGHVEIGDDVEIGACTTIDRGTFGATRIGSGTKIDNLVQVAHNCQIGRHNLFVSQMGIAGSSSTGDHVVIAGQVGVVDHVHIGPGSVIGAKAGVTKDVPAGQHMLGAPATPEREQKRILMTLERLPEIRRDIARIKKQLGLSDGLNSSEAA